MTPTVQDNAVVYANRAMSKLLASDGDELSGKMVEEVLPAVAVPRVRELSGQVDGSGALPVVEGEFRHGDGSSVNVEMRVFAADFQGVRSVICVLRNTTERMRLRAKMAHMDRMAAVGTLAAGVAHEINNPLSFIKANAEYLQHSRRRATELDEAEFSEVIADICEGAEQIRQIVAGLRTYARKDLVEKPSESVDLAHLVESMVKMANSEIRHRARLTVDLPELPLVRGGASELGQVILNLLLNAAQAIAPGARAENEICIRARRSGERVELEISDTGAGIPAEIQPRIFDPFFTTKAQGFDDLGMGLGLYICQSIVNNHEGELSFESTEGVGTTFRVTLEVFGEETSLEEDEPSTLQIITAEAKILIVDDETRVLSSLKRTLADHEVLVASSGAEALKTIEAHPDIDLIVCDLLMPEMTGMQLYEVIEERFPALADRVIFITGGVSDVAMRRFVESGKNRVLNKPFGADELRREIKGLMMV